MENYSDTQATEYYINNVRYEVASSFKSINNGAESGDLLDKLKHLILTKELNIKGKKTNFLCFSAKYVTINEHLSIVKSAGR